MPHPGLPRSYLPTLRAILPNLAGFLDEEIAHEVERAYGALSLALGPEALAASWAARVKEARRTLFRLQAFGPMELLLTDDTGITVDRGAPPFAPLLAALEQAWMARGPGLPLAEKERAAVVQIRLKIDALGKPGQIKYTLAQVWGGGGIEGYISTDALLKAWGG